MVEMGFFIWALIFIPLLNAQNVPSLQDYRPPVARVNQQWSWVIPSAPLNLTSGSGFSVQPLPRWAQFDSSTLTFSGLPGAGDVGVMRVAVGINSASNTSQISAAFNLMVVNEPVSVVGESVKDQLPGIAAAGAGPNYPSGSDYVSGTIIRVTPWWTFSLGFQQSTIQPAPSLGSRIVYYSAFSGNGTPIPWWLTFDNTTCTFDGAAPDDIQKYEIRLCGSDHFGYCDVDQNFTIQVGYHSFELGKPFPQINTTLDAVINYVVPLDHLLIDNRTASSANVSTIRADLSTIPFLSFNNTGYLFHGQVPHNFSGPRQLEIPITVIDTANDTINATIPLAILPSLFTAPVLQTAKINTTDPFTIDLHEYVTNPVANYSVTFERLDWITFNENDLTLTGKAPESPTTLRILLAGHMESTGLNDTATLPIDVAQKPPTGNVGGSLSKAGKIALGLTFGMVLFCLLIGLLWCKFSRSQRKKNSRLSDATLVGGLVHAQVYHCPMTPKTPKSDEKDNFYEKKTKEEISNEDVMVSPSIPRRLGMMSMLKTSVHRRNVSSISVSERHDGSHFYGISSLAEHPSQHRIFSLNSISHSSSEGQEQASSVIKPPSCLSSKSTGSGIGGSGSISITATDFSSTWETDESSSYFYSEHSLHQSSPKRRRDFVPNRLRPLRSMASIPSVPSLPSLRSLSTALDIRRVSTPDVTLPSIQNTPVFAPRDYSQTSLSSTNSPSRKPAKFVKAHIEQERRAAATTLEAVQDADEPEETQSPPPAYQSSVLTPKTISAVYYPSPRIFDDVGTNETSIEFDDAEEDDQNEDSASAKSGLQIMATNSKPLKRVTVGVNDSFTFTPEMNPPPFVSIGNSSPTRGRAARSTYNLMLESKKQLPSFIHFDQASMYIWGMPRPEDVGEYDCIMVEKKRSRSGSPTRAGSLGVSMQQVEQTEQVVSRFILEVQDNVELQIISF